MKYLEKFNSERFTKEDLFSAFAHYAHKTTKPKSQSDLRKEFENWLDKRKNKTDVDWYSPESDKISENKMNESKNNEDIIYELKYLIKSWERSKEILKEMIEDWKEYDDPGSDPGLQYEQEMEVEKRWEKIKEYCKKAF